MNHAKGRLLLYAPNVHTGGGRILLEALLAAWPQGLPLRAWFDERARSSLHVPETAQVDWVGARVTSRLAGELALRKAAREGDTILCFHGLPPLLKNPALIEVFVQNRLHLGQMPLTSFSWRTRQRLRFEQAVCRLRRHLVHRYWVQTPSMARALQQWWGDDLTSLSAQVLPFVPLLSAAACAEDTRPRYDFVYIADGEAHKNHRRLVEAWVHLARQGLRPSLALTLSARDQVLAHWIAEQCQAHDLKIHQLGSMSHQSALALYRHAQALIFPSLGESFGLPLLEAKAQGCAILASELDFVRDVCEPVETFDPQSPVSIARAVRRFLRQPEHPAAPADAASFLRALGSFGA